MRRGSSRYHTRWLFGALLALGVFSPQAAVAAGCLHPGRTDSEIRAAAHFDRLIDAGAMPSPALPEELPFPKPCSGFLCSGSSGIPMPPAPSLDHSSSSQWAIGSAILSSAALGFGPLSPSTNLPKPIHEGSSPFHPPRG
jgi:hypothetical protein